MNDRQTNKLNDYRALLGVLANYAGKIAVYAIVARKVEAFKNLISTIQDLAKRTAIDTTGVTSSKGDVKKEMATVAAELAAAGMAYAADKKDAQLEASFDVGYSEVENAKDEDALNLTRMLCDELDEHIDELAEYLVAPEDVAELTGLADRFEGLAETKGSTKVDSKTAHKQLKVAFKEADMILDNHLDLLMIRLKRKEPELVSAYFSVRHTNRKVDTGGSAQEEPVTE